MTSMMAEHKGQKHAPDLCLAHAWHTTELGDLATCNSSPHHFIKCGCQCRDDIHTQCVLIGQELSCCA